MLIIRDDAIDRIIAEKVLEEQAKNKENHIPSGRLSASLLGNPLQWQILKVFGQKGDFDEYTLRKFQRGKDVEARLVSWLDPTSKQEEVLYRGVIGYLDFMWTPKKRKVNNFGTMPAECKSVTNMKFKRIEKEGKPDRGHTLQGCLYALGKQSEYFAVVYVASDDYRTATFVLKTSEWQPEVDRIIDRFNAQLLTGTIPVFVPDEEWQKNPKYNAFPEWAGLNQEEIEKKLEGLIKANKTKQNDNASRKV